MEIDDLIDEVVGLEDSSLASNSPEFLVVVSRLLSSVDQFLSICSSESLFSGNEELDEVATTALPFLTLNFLKATLVYQTPAEKPSQRKKIVQQTKQLTTKFLRQIFTLGEKIFQDQNEFKTVRKVIGEDENENSNENENLETVQHFDRNSQMQNFARLGLARDEKIARYKKEKEAAEKLAHLKKRKAFMAKKKTDGEAFFDESLFEETARKLALLQLESFTRKAIDLLPTLDQELSLLSVNRPDNNFGENDEKMPKNEQNSKNENSKNSKGKMITLMPMSHSGSTYAQQRQAQLMYEERICLGGGAQNVVETYQTDTERLMSQMFLANRNPATVSLEEFAKQEQEEAMQRSIQQKEQQQKEKKEEEEDEKEENEQKRKKQTNWDDWKDEHQRGEGNLKAHS